MAATQEAAQDQEQQVAIVSKMSVKTIGCNPRMGAALEKGKNLHITLCRIYGMATGHKSVEDNTTGAIHEPILGNFEAQLLQGDHAGKLTRSGVLYLPKGIHDMVLEAVKSLEPKQTVNFALEIRSVPADNPIGYSYEAVPLIKPVEVDPLEAMRTSLPVSKAAKALGTGGKA